MTEWSFWLKRFLSKYTRLEYKFYFLYSFILKTPLIVYFRQAMAQLLILAHAPRLWSYATCALPSKHSGGQITSPDEQISRLDYLFCFVFMVDQKESMSSNIKQKRFPCTVQTAIISPSLKTGALWCRDCKFRMEQHPSGHAAMWKLSTTRLCVMKPHLLPDLIIFSKAWTHWCVQFFSYRSYLQKYRKLTFYPFLITFG